jgi:hypothetical protein
MAGSTYRISGIPGQTERLQEWTTSGGIPLAYIGHDGRFWNSNSVTANSISASSISATSLSGNLFATEVEAQSLSLTGSGNALSIISSSFPGENQTIFGVFSMTILADLFAIKSDGDAEFYGNVSASSFTGDGSNISNVNTSILNGINVDLSGIQDGDIIHFDQSENKLVPTEVSQAQSSGVSSVNSNTGDVSLDTDDIPETTQNKYWTDTRANSLKGPQFTHEQSSPEATWIIIHNLGYKPNIKVIDSSQGTVEGGENHLSNNTVELTFQNPFSGTAYLY